MNLELKDKKIVITASTDGIGYATAYKFLEEGACVLINGRDSAKAEQKRRLLQKRFGENRVFLYIGDMVLENEISKLREYAGQVFSHIDCMIANVGSGKPIGQNRLCMNEWRKSFEINLFSAVKLVEVFDDMWDESRGGSIVVVSSLAAYSRISAPYAYAAAKQGVSVFSKYLSDDYAIRKIRVNSVIPGNVCYKGGRWEELIHENEEAVREYIERSVPLKRFAMPDEIANVIVFLSSSCASFITGSSLLIDGGQSRTII